MIDEACEQDFTGGLSWWVPLYPLKGKSCSDGLGDSGVGSCYNIGG